MSNATLDIKTDQYGTPDEVLPPLYNFPMAASTKVYAGTFGATDASGNVISTLTTAAKIWGRIERQVDNTSGLAGALSAEIHAGFFYFNNDSTNPCTNAMRGSAAFAVDNNTAGSSSVGGSLLYAGYIVDVPASGSVEYGKVLVACGMINPYIVNPELATSLASQFTAHVVATNLAALTFTAGSFSADANGALATQDGIAVGASGIAVGDIIIFPQGTITTGVVSAANSGPWQLTSVGGASAKFTGIRPSWWPHGGNVPTVSIKVAAGQLFGGTEWRPYSDTLVGGTPLVIGTGDPKLYPKSVTQKVTLSSSAATITNVPIFSATRSNVIANLSAVGGTTTNTIGWGPIVAPTPGGIGTASTVVNAIASGGTKNGTADTSDVLVTIVNG